MKMKPVKLMLLGITLLSAMFIASCSSNDDPVEGDKTALSAAVTVTEAALNTAVEGSLEGQFQSGSKATLQAALDAAKAVVADTKAEQPKVNSALANLQAALEAFKAKVVAPIDLANLVGRWKFDEGTGTTANDESTNNFDGTFKTGAAAWGAGVPTWSADRFGTANKALHFDKGANIEVPYNSALNPTKMSISIWVKADEVKAGNRFIGLQSWIGYKFELQEANRPFLSIGKPDGGTYDRDSQQDLPINEWHHLIATFGDGNMVFYVDGELVKSWNDTPGDARSISGAPYNLVFGQDFPTDKYAATDTNFDNDHIIPLAWGGFFHGSLDDIRIYKSVLSASQVASIYASEKP
jgi:hypothetical protein